VNPKKIRGPQHPQARDLPCCVVSILDAFESGNTLARKSEKQKLQEFRSSLFVKYLCQRLQRNQTSTAASQSSVQQASHQAESSLFGSGHADGRFVARQGFSDFAKETLHGHRCPGVGMQIERAFCFSFNRRNRSTNRASRFCFTMRRAESCRPILQLLNSATPDSCLDYASLPQQFLYFFPLPHGQGSLRPTFGASLRATGMTNSSSSPFLSPCSSRANPRCSRRGTGPVGTRAGC